MTLYKLLSIDESGKATYAHKSALFVLSGIATPEKFKPELDKLTRKIKKKLGNTANPSVFEVLIGQ